MIIIIIFIYCNWVVNRWHCLFYMYTKYEETVDAPGNDSNASTPERVKRPNQWRKMMMTKYEIGYY